MAVPVPGLMVVGTDTGVGKTRITNWIVRHLASRGVAVGVCKPAVTGAQKSGDTWIWHDVEHLRASCPLDVPLSMIAPFRWIAPLAPAVANRLEGGPCDDAGVPMPERQPSLTEFLTALDSWNASCDVLIVEGVGGLLCPLTAEATVADLAVAWGRPIVVVARLGLGTLNHTLLTVEALHARRLDVRAVLLNTTVCDSEDESERSNPDELRTRLTVPVWGPVEFQQDWRTVPPTIESIAWLSVAGRA